jgi:hypothetical protein
MTDELYRTPMNGTLSVCWSLGTNEDGEPEGFIGIPKSPDDQDEMLRDCLGSDIFFACDLRAIDDESLALSIRSACLHAAGRYVMPQLIRFMVDAAVELRERAGGFSQELYEERLAVLQAEIDAEDSADEAE